MNQQPSQPPQVIVVHHSGGCAGLIGQGCRGVFIFILICLLAILAVMFLGQKQISRAKEEQIDWATARSQALQGFIKRIYSKARQVDFFDFEVGGIGTEQSSAKTTFNAWITENYAERDRIRLVWSSDQRLEDAHSIWTGRSFYPKIEPGREKGPQEDLPSRNGEAAKAKEWLLSRAEGKYTLKNLRWKSVVAPSAYVSVVDFETVSESGAVTPQRFRFIYWRQTNLTILIENLLTKEVLAQTEVEEHLQAAARELGYVISAEPE